MSDPDPSTSEFPVVERRGLGPKLYDEIKHPKARKSDGGWRYWCVWLYTRTLPLVATVVACIALAGTQSDVQRQAEGRAVAIDVLCGFGNGVAQAGRNVIRGRRADGRKIPGVTFTEREQRIRDAAAQDYGGFIVQTVQAQAGVRSRDVVERDGTLSCTKLRIAAKATR